MVAKDILAILNDLHKELEANSLDISAVLLVSDHSTGEAFFYNTGFKDIQAILLKMLFEKDPVLKAVFVNTMIQQIQVPS